MRRYGRNEVARTTMAEAVLSLALSVTLRARSSHLRCELEHIERGRALLCVDKQASSGLTTLSTP